MSTRTFPAAASFPIGVIGAGIMGAGIAYVAAAAGHEVTVTDASSATLSALPERIRAMAASAVKHGTLPADGERAVTERIRCQTSLSVFARCALIIEAVAESITVKDAVLEALGGLANKECIVATNTSSLSVTRLARSYARPQLVAGFHFFNPAQIMPLVEIARGLDTDDGVAAHLVSLAHAWGKTPIVVRDTPGFIVNRVARQFYLEALRIVEHGVAAPRAVDDAMTAAGFKMGPFELMDLIGLDTNHAVSLALYAGFYQDARYRPSLIQQQLVDAGRLGRKTGRGFYVYPREKEPPGPVDAKLSGRIIAMLVNEAVDALHLRIASYPDIETAMQRGVNYPRGLLDWGESIGWRVVLGTVEALRSEYGEMYRPSPLLMRLAESGELIEAFRNG